MQNELPPLVIELASRSPAIGRQSYRANEANREDHSASPSYTGRTLVVHAHEECTIGHKHYNFNAI